MQHLEVSGAVRPIYVSLGVKHETVKEKIKYLKLGKYCIAFPGVISENTFVKSVSCWGVS